MGLSASLFSGITGLSAHGEQMSVIGNNIANVNTIGFKATRMYFEDAISQDISTSQGVGQVGRGVKVGAIYSDYGQGSFETTNESTDLAIGGDGFFILQAKNEETTYYTRAGNFRFDKDGYLVDPHGYVLQGWEVEESSTNSLQATSATSAQAETSATTRIQGVPTDIRLENFQSSPKATTGINVVTNLDSTDESRLDSQNGNQFFALAEQWDGSREEPIGQTQYAYQTTLKVYDQNGSSHNISIYYDQVTLSNAGGKKVWEYIVTCDPNEDGRYYLSGGNAVLLNQTSAAGLLGMGTMTFNPAGELENLSSFVLTSGSAATGNLKQLSNWKLNPSFSTEGRPQVVANFLGVSGASFVNSSDVNEDDVDVLISLDFGINSKSLSWNGGINPANSNASLFNTGGPDADPDGADVAALPGLNNTNIKALSTTSYSAGSTTIFQSQDGYSAGFLQNIAVDRDGVMTGRFSNGQVLELYVLTLADFNNQWGLNREGGNLFSETRESGPAITNRPNEAGLGSISANSLEQSNVDLATEFVKMITTQRGFQANSKVITTTDSMLGELIMLKR